MASPFLLETVSNKTFFNDIDLSVLSLSHFFKLNSGYNQNTRKGIAMVFWCKSHGILRKEHTLCRETQLGSDPPPFL